MGSNGFLIQFITGEKLLATGMCFSHSNASANKAEMLHMLHLSACISGGKGLPFQWKQLCCSKALFIARRLHKPDSVFAVFGGHVEVQFAPYLFFEPKANWLYNLLEGLLAYPVMIHAAPCLEAGCAWFKTRFSPRDLYSLVPPLLQFQSIGAFMIAQSVSTTAPLESRVNLHKETLTTKTVWGTDHLWKPWMPLCSHAGFTVANYFGGGELPLFFFGFPWRAVETYLKLMLNYTVFVCCSRRFVTTPCAGWCGCGLVLQSPILT